VFHSSWPVEVPEQGRSGYNVPDDGNPASYSMVSGGHYFGAAVDGESVEFNDDGLRSRGKIEEVQEMGRKIVCVVLKRTYRKPAEVPGTEKATEESTNTCTHTGCVARGAVVLGCSNKAYPAGCAQTKRMRKKARLNSHGGSVRRASLRRNH
jgi:hypothetical protein